MKTALVYYSMSGNVEYVAKKIAEKIDVDLIRLEPSKEYPSSGFKKFFWGGKSAVMGEAPTLLPYEFDASQYDRVILGTPVWASTFTPPIRTFLQENPSIKDKHVSVFFCYSGGGADKASAKLKEALGISAFEKELILIDPMNKPSEENEKSIEEFCK